MQDRFSKYMGKLKVEMDGEKEPFMLELEIQDKHKIMVLMQEFAKTPTEDSFKRLSDVLLVILKRSYPDAKPEELNMFLVKKYEAFMSGLSIAFGWTTKKELEEKIRQRRKSLGLEKNSVPPEADSGEGRV